MNRRTLSMSVVVAACIVLAAIVNHLLPITFSMYFLLSGVSIVLCYLLRRKKNASSLLLPWLLTAVCTVMVTKNYLHPTADTYTNADTHVLTLRGVEQKHRMLLVDSRRPEKALFDDPTYGGILSVTVDSSGRGVLSGSLTSVPLYVERGGTYQLSNARSMPAFGTRMSVSEDKSSIEIEVHNHVSHPLFGSERADSSDVIVSYYREGKKQRCDTSSFHTYVTHGYNLYDMARSGIVFDPLADADEERLMDHLRDVWVVRRIVAHDSGQDIAPSDTLHLLLPSMRGVTVRVDGKEVKRDNGTVSDTLKAGERFFLGIGHSRSQLWRYERGGTDSVRLCYDMPLMRHFPNDRERKSHHHIVHLTTSQHDLLESDVSQAFYFDLFHGKKNDYHLSGIISYQSADSRTPFEPRIIDQRTNQYAQTGIIRHYQLSTPSGAKWQLSVDDLRSESPVSGGTNLFVTDAFIWFIIFVLLCFSLSVCSIMWRGSSRAAFALGIWLFFIPIVTLRLFLLWRIAVFPPVEDISRHVFQVYRMEGGFLHNGMVVTIAMTALLMACTIAARWGRVPQRVKDLYQRMRADGKHQREIISALWTFTLAVVLIGHGPLICLALPLTVFFVCEWFTLRHLPLIWHAVNVGMAIISFLLGDPGYAILFAIFACLYISYLLMVHRRSVHSSHQLLSRQLTLLSVLLVVMGVLGSSWLLGKAYDSRPLWGDSWLTYARATLIVISVLIIIVTWRILRESSWWQGLHHRRWWALCGVAVMLTSVLYFVPRFLDANGHFKYRALIHTQEVGTIMRGENILERNSERLLQAAQNQWFIQYHNNKGDSLATDSRLFVPSPHFRKGVTWPTQLSDVILSRYVVGEISSILPVCIIILALAFLWFVMRMPGASSSGRMLSWAVSLLIAVQMTFVWLANTNRMVFFGQDFPFLTHNALIVSCLFALLLGTLFGIWGEERDTSVKHDYLLGMRQWHESGGTKWFFGGYIVVFAIVVLFGNNYRSLYGGKEAWRFNLNTAMRQAESDLQPVNALLGTYRGKDRRLKNDDNLTPLWNDIEQRLHLSESVEQMYADTLISPFTYSLYQAFRDNLKKRNRFDNIIHLRHIGRGYELALNNGFYSLHSPDADERQWQGQVYSEVRRNERTERMRRVGPVKEDHFMEYEVPSGWTSGGKTAIIDCRDKRYDRYLISLHRDGESYAMKSHVFPLRHTDVAEFTRTDGSTTFTHSLRGSQDELLVKNMRVNGSRRLIYPHGSDLYWLREYAGLFDYVDAPHRHSNDTLTIDAHLQHRMQALLRDSTHGMQASVVGMDGDGRVRLLSDYKGKRYVIDPNDEQQVQETHERTYLNPIARENQLYFGNMNLQYMQPGPGSSMKPLTYAAVTSQTLGRISWGQLMLEPPTPFNSEQGNLLHFGPSYTFDPPFTSVAADEAGHGGWVDDRYYLQHSSNFFNALVTYIGLMTEVSDTLWRISDDVTDYPRVRIGMGGLLTPRAVPPAAQGSSLLNLGLRNLGLVTSEHDSLSTFYHESWVRGWLSSGSETPRLFPWVFPNVSTAYYSHFRDMGNPSRQLKQYALGSYPLQLTPVKMAEMYGRLFAMTTDYSAHLYPQAMRGSGEWTMLDSLRQDRLFGFFQRHLYEGMRLCSESGTGASMVDRSRLPGGYHLYMKTGTLKLEHKDNDRMLAVVITDRDVTQAERASDYRFYVVYLRVVQSRLSAQELRNLVTRVLSEVMRSQSFQQYFHSEEKNEK